MLVVTIKARLTIPANSGKMSYHIDSLGHKTRKINSWAKTKFSKEISKYRPVARNVDSLGDKDKKLI